MHTVEMLESALDLARRLGYHVRLEWLDGSGGGVCEFAAKKWLFIDLALSTDEQLEQVVDSLRDDPALVEVRVPACLARRLRRRSAA